MINKLKSWHIDLIEKVQKLAGLSNYQSYRSVLLKVDNWFVFGFDFINYKKHQISIFKICPYKIRFHSCGLGFCYQ